MGKSRRSASGGGRGRSGGSGGRGSGSRRSASGGGRGRSGGSGGRGSGGGRGGHRSGRGQPPPAIVSPSVTQVGTKPGTAAQGTTNSGYSARVLQFNDKKSKSKRNEDKNFTKKPRSSDEELESEEAKKRGSEDEDNATEKGTGSNEECDSINSESEHSEESTAESEQSSSDSESEVSKESIAGSNEECDSSEDVETEKKGKESEEERHATDIEETMKDGKSKEEQHGTTTNQQSKKKEKGKIAYRNDLSPVEQQVMNEKTRKSNKERGDEIEKRANDVYSILSKHRDALQMKIDMAFCRDFCRHNPTAFDTLLHWVYTSHRLCSGVKAKCDSTHFGLVDGVHHALDLIVKPKDPKQKIHLEYTLLERHHVATRLREHGVGKRYEKLLSIISQSSAAVPVTEVVKNTTIRDYIRVYYDLFEIYAHDIKCPPGMPPLKRDSDVVFSCKNEEEEKECRSYVNEMHTFFTRLLAGCSFSQLVRNKCDLRQFVRDARNRDLSLFEVKEEVFIKFARNNQVTDSDEFRTKILYKQTRELWQKFQLTPRNDEKQLKCKCIRITDTLKDDFEIFPFLKFFVPEVFDCHFLAPGGSLEVPYSAGMLLQLYCLRTYLHHYQIKIEKKKIFFSLQDGKKNTDATIVVGNNAHLRKPSPFVVCSHVFSVLERYPGVDLSNDEHFNTIRSIIPGGERFYKIVQDKAVVEMAKNSRTKARSEQTNGYFDLHVFVKEFTMRLQEFIAKRKKGTVLVLHKGFFCDDVEAEEKKFGKLKEERKKPSGGNVFGEVFKKTLDSNNADEVIGNFIRQTYIKNPMHLCNLENAVFISDRVDAVLAAQSCADGDVLRKTLESIKCPLVMYVSPETTEILSKQKCIVCVPAELDWLPTKDSSEHKEWKWTKISYDATANVDDDVEDENNDDDEDDIENGDTGSSLPPADDHDASSASEKKNAEMPSADTVKVEGSTLTFESVEQLNNFVESSMSEGKIKVSAPGVPEGFVITNSAFPLYGCGRYIQCTKTNKFGKIESIDSEQLAYKVRTEDDKVEVFDWQNVHPLVDGDEEGFAGYHRNSEGVICQTIVEKGTKTDNRQSAMMVANPLTGVSFPFPAFEKGEYLWSIKKEIGDEKEFPLFGKVTEVDYKNLTYEISDEREQKEQPKVVVRGFDARRLAAPPNYPRKGYVPVFKMCKVKGAVNHLCYFEKKDAGPALTEALGFARADVPEAKTIPEQEICKYAVEDYKAYHVHDSQKKIVDDDYDYSKKILETRARYEAELKEATNDGNDGKVKKLTRLLSTIDRKKKLYEALIKSIVKIEATLKEANDKEEESDEKKRLTQLLSDKDKEKKWYEDDLWQAEYLAEMREAKKRKSKSNEDKNSTKKPRSSDEELESTEAKKRGSKDEEDATEKGTGSNEECDSSEDVETDKKKQHATGNHLSPVEQQGMNEKTGKSNKERGDEIEKRANDDSEKKEGAKRKRRKRKKKQATSTEQIDSSKRKKEEHQGEKKKKNEKGKRKRED